MQISTSISVVQRRVLAVDSQQAFLIPLLEPLFAIETHMSFEERVKLFETSLSLPVGFVACEVGSYLGASTAFIAAAGSIRQGHVHAVDTWQNDAMPGEPVLDTFESFLRNTQRFCHLITAHRGRARCVKDSVPEVNMLFIDGDHSYEAALADLADYVPKIRAGGLLVLHDYNYETIRRAVRDYFRDRPPADLGLTHSLQVFRLA